MEKLDLIVTSGERAGRVGFVSYSSERYAEELELTVTTGEQKGKGRRAGFVSIVACML